MNIRKNIFLTLLCYLFIQSAYADGKSNEEPLALIDKEPVTIRDLNDKVIHDLRKQLYEAQKQKLMVIVVERLSKKYPKIISNPAPTVTDKEARAFYDSNNLKGRDPYPVLAPKIKGYLKSQKLAALTKREFKRAITKGLAVNHLKDPGGFVVSTPVRTAFIRGNKRANVMLLEFSDYQCPFCRRVQASVASLIKKYKGKVAFGYRHFPLSGHTEADEAAVAVECARDQGRFPEYHAILWKNQSKQYVADLKKYARKVDVADPARFDKCLDSRKYYKRMQKDIADGSDLGINGTPSFVVGTYDRKKGIVRGEMLSGALPESSFKALLDKYLITQTNDG